MTQAYWLNKDEESDEQTITINNSMFKEFLLNNPDAQYTFIYNNCPLSQFLTYHARLQDETVIEVQVGDDEVGFIYEGDTKFEGHYYSLDENEYHLQTKDKQFSDSTLKYKGPGWHEIPFGQKEALELYALAYE